MKITAVIVLYKQSIDQCKTFQTLKKALSCNQHGIKELDIILYDNSPDEQVFEQNVLSGFPVSYVHDNRNLGIATAYNYALSIAKENRSEWLLLLDQDSELTEEYIEKFTLLGTFDKSVVAVVPKITFENTMISPVFSNTLRPLKGEKPSTGLQEKPVMAINSGSFLRISFLQELSGFNLQFPLDYLDHWLFHEIYAKGNKVFLLDTCLEHELSVMDYSRVSIQRYRSILDSEINFYKNYKNDLLTSYKKQLVKRLLKQILLVKNKKIAAYTLRRIVSM
jgi:GT2 family glycosyltransferase